MDKEEIDVTVIIPVYNHEKYIKKALESVFMQKFFPRLEVLVGEDCSTDRSREILQEIAKNAPNYVKFIYREKNYGAKGNIHDLCLRMKGRYFAILEGDDYWTYNCKLQEQYDFLEAHPEYIAVAHNTEVINANGDRVLWPYPECKNDKYRACDYRKGLLAGQTATILARNYYKYNMFDLNLVEGYSTGDRIENFLLFCNGEIKCIQKKWSCYRLVTNSGSSFSANYKRLSPQDELIGQRGLYEYASKNHIDQDKYRAIEQVYFIFLLKKMLLRQADIHIENYIVEFKHAKYKFSIFAYSLRCLVLYPFDRIKMLFRKKAFYKNT